jgi:hypothetical protein
MAFTTLLVMLALSLGAASIMMYVAARVSSSPNRESSGAVPANATMIQAWLAIARRPSRRNIAAWARAADRSWVVASLVVGEALVLAINAASFIHATIWPRPLAKGARYLFGAPSPLGRLYFALDLAPIEALIGVVALAYVFARVMPPSQETLAVRFERVLAPYALAGVPSTVAGFVSVMLSFIPHQPVLHPHTFQPVALVIGTLTFPVAIYGFVLDLNSLAAGTGMNRWKIFFVWLVVGAIIGGVELYLLPLLALPFGIHFSPVTWP